MGYPDIKIKQYLPLYKYLPDSGVLTFWLELLISNEKEAERNSSIQ
jgi:hypothetical protein